MSCIDYNIIGSASIYHPCFLLVMHCTNMSYGRKLQTISALARCCSARGKQKLGLGMEFIF